MLKRDTEVAVGKLLYIGVPAVTLLVTGFANYDPVNVPKMFFIVSLKTFSSHSESAKYLYQC